MLTLVIEIKNVLTKVFINLRSVISASSEQKRADTHIYLHRKLENISWQGKQTDIWMNNSAKIYSYCVSDRGRREEKKGKVIGG